MENSHRYRIHLQRFVDNITNRGWCFRAAAFGWNMQKVCKSRVRIEVLGDIELAFWVAKAGDHQNQRQISPANLLAAVGKPIAQKPAQPQALDQLKAEPDIAEIARVFGANSFDIDFYPFRLLRFKQLLLTLFVRVSQANAKPTFGVISPR